MWPFRQAELLSQLSDSINQFAPNYGNIARCRYGNPHFILFDPCDDDFYVITNENPFTEFTR